MNIEQFREFCLELPATEESFPFDEVTLVFKVGNKMYALMGLDNIDNPSANLKCDPAKSIELREEYEGVKPGFHMNKKHWNTVSLDSDVNDDMIYELIKESYNLVLKSLTKKLIQELNLN
jgi:predicted DNA-binding protein (MmcQ/YjbR family)